MEESQIREVEKFPELVFGLIGAIGTDSEKIIAELKSSLNLVNYDVITIHLIEGVRQIEKWSGITTTPLDARYHSHMNAGDEFRELLELGEALALLGAAAIAKERTLRTGARNIPKIRTAYILRSLKRPEEISALRKIYGRNFFALAAYSTRTTRHDKLAKRIAASQSKSVNKEIREIAETLISRDEAELNTKFGQDIQEAFPISDFIVDADSSKLPNQIRRIIELIFGNTFHTPTREEYGMFHAWAASLRSASLGRQVGAAISTNEGDLLATGCNEVPKAHGGLYWAGDEPDARDHEREQDSNDLTKHQMLEDVLARLKKLGWLNIEKTALSSETLLKLALEEKSASSLKKATLMGITEYGRMVHAEMAALMQAARLGISIRDANLFCTTFPCHNCTKHIVAAGIKSLTYIEPYPKSRAHDLHEDAISIEPDDANDVEGKVAFRSFMGVSPRQYFHLFSLGDSIRKEGSKVKKWKNEESSPRLVDSPFACLTREEEELEKFDLLLQKHKLIPVEK